MASRLRLMIRSLRLEVRGTTRLGVEIAGSSAKLRASRGREISDSRAQTILFMIVLLAQREYQP
ncbi:hypothetical protein KGY58_05670 [Candidatus Bipolaricaulota bacterium]|nr:hypothetical protein [Candidatus Bipolaricaulota bacterium]